MAAIHPLPGTISIVGRNQSLRLGIDVDVVVRRANEKPAAEATKTLIVRVNGALIPLRMAIAIGEVLTVTNLQTREEVSCRVVGIEPNSESKMTEVELEFVEPAPRFWSVFFPPKSWTSRGAESKGYVPRIALPLKKGLGT
jgi:hypothetical protein